MSDNLSEHGIPNDDKGDFSVTNLGQGAVKEKEGASPTPLSKNDYKFFMTNVEKIVVDMNTQIMQEAAKEITKNLSGRISILPNDWKHGLKVLGGILLAGGLLHVITKLIDYLWPRCFLTSIGC